MQPSFPSRTVIVLFSLLTTLPSVAEALTLTFPQISGAAFAWTSVAIGTFIAARFYIHEWRIRS